MDVGLYGIDLAFNNAGIFLEVELVTKAGFKCTAYAPKGSLVYFLAVDFVAFIPKKGYSLASISHKDFDEDQLISWKSGSNLREVIAKVPVP